MFEKAGTMHYITKWLIGLGSVSDLNLRRRPNMCTSDRGGFREHDPEGPFFLPVPFAKTGKGLPVSVRSGMYLQIR